MKYLRIKKNTQFQTLFKRGKRAFSKSVTILYTPSKQMQMGIAVSKKHGKAVQRNRIKRLIREAFSKCVDSIESPQSIIILPKVMQDYTLNDFTLSIATCIKRINSDK